MGPEMHVVAVSPFRPTEGALSPLLCIEALAAQDQQVVAGAVAQRHCCAAFGFTSHQGLAALLAVGDAVEGEPGS